MTTQKADKEILRCAFHRCLVTLRWNANIAQEQLALEAGIDRGYMGGLERGLHSPTLDTLFKLFPPLGISFIQFAAEFETSMKHCHRTQKHKGPKAIKHP